MAVVSLDAVVVTLEGLARGMWLCVALAPVWCWWVICADDRKWAANRRVVMSERGGWPTTTSGVTGHRDVVKVGSGEDPVSSPIRQALGGQMDLLTDLHRALDALTMRLGPVSLPSPPEGTGLSQVGGPPVPLMSGMRQEILERNAGVSAAVERVKALSERLDV